MRPKVNNDILLCFGFSSLAVISLALEHRSLLQIGQPLDKPVITCID